MSQPKESVKVYYCEDLYTKDEMIANGYDYDSDENNDDFDEFVSVVYHSDHLAAVAENKVLIDALNAENKVLKAQLRVCKQQRDGEIWQDFDSTGSKETINNYDDELAALEQK